MPEISNCIRRLRFDHDEMTQQELANRAGVTRQTIIAIEGGKYAPSLPLAFRIAKVFGVSVEDVFQYEDAQLGTKASGRHQKGRTATVLFEEFIVNKKFSEQTRRALSLAEQEARSYEHQYMGTEHLLLGVVGSAAANVAERLRGVGVDLARVRAAFENRLLRGEKKTDRGLPLMPRALNALNFAIEKAAAGKVSPEGLLLALLQHQEAMSAKILRDLGVDITDLARQLS